MNNYTFNGELPTMQDTLRVMAAFANDGQPSYELQRHFVENAHITFKEIDNLAEWKKQYNVTEYEGGFMNLYCDGRKVGAKIYYVPRYDKYEFIKELNSKRFEKIGIVEIYTYKTKEEVESHNRFSKHQVKIGDKYILTALHSEIISIEDGHTLDIEIGVTSGYIVYDGLYYLNDKNDKNRKWATDYHSIKLRKRNWMKLLIGLMRISTMMAKIKADTMNCVTMQTE